MTRHSSRSLSSCVSTFVALMAIGLITVSTHAQDAAPAAPAPAPAAPAPESPATAADGAAAATTAPATTQAVPVDQTTPRGALKVLANAMETGDRTKILNVFHTTSPLEEGMANAMADMANSLAKLRKSIADVYGDEGIRALNIELPPAGESDRLVDSATETVTDNQATVQLGDSPPAKLTQVDGQWKFPVAELAQGVPPEALELDIEMNKGQAVAIEAISDEIAQKKYATIEEVKTALDTKLRQLVDERNRAATMPATAPATAPSETPPVESPTEAPATPSTEAPAVPADPATPAAPAPAE